MKTFTATIAALLATLSLANAQTQKCDPNNKCPDSAPCCSQYGDCGVGAYCLGGCDPKSSFSLQSCMAAPTCKSADYKFDSLDDVMPNTKYLGDASKANWVSSGTAVEYNGDSLLLTMAPSTVGTLLSSTHYVWYGKTSVTMTSSQGQGVVTAFILMSDMKDEIDFEFVGDNVDSAQSNYYYQGITNYENMVPLKTSDTRVNTHTYTIDWTPDQITWSIDGKEMRTLKRDDTWNASSGSYHYPQTPSRIQLSLWPAGLDTNGKGTIEWSGGLVNWDSQYMQNGYYFAMISDVTVECYDPPSGFSGDAGGSAYYYNNLAGNNNTVVIGKNNTILGSLMASGENPDYDPNAKASGTSDTDSEPTNTPLSVPGISGGGNVASSRQAPTEEGSNGGSSPGSGAGSGSVSSGGSSGFSQGGNNAGTSQAPKVVAGSAVALLGFFVAALMI